MLNAMDAAICPSQHSLTKSHNTVRIHQGTPSLACSQEERHPPPHYKMAIFLFAEVMNTPTFPTMSHLTFLRKEFSGSEGLTEILRPINHALAIRPIIYLITKQPPT